MLVNGERTRDRCRVAGRAGGELGFAEGQVATALNGEFVPRQARAATRLAADDRVEIVAPRQGG